MKKELLNEKIVSLNFGKSLRMAQRGTSRQADSTSEQLVQGGIQERPQCVRLISDPSREKAIGTDPSCCVKASVRAYL